MQAIATAKTDTTLETPSGSVTIQKGDTFCGAVNSRQLFVFWLKSPDGRLVPKVAPEGLFTVKPLKRQTAWKQKKSAKTANGELPTQNIPKRDIIATTPK